MNAFRKRNIKLPSKGIKDGLYSIALDLGTTNLAALLIENDTGRIIAENKYKSGIAESIDE